MRTQPATPTTATRREARQRSFPPVFGATVLATLLVSAACGGDPGQSAGDPSAVPATDFTQQGPIEYWAGKDTSGNLRNLIAQFNEETPEGKVTFHELPDNADLQRQQMVQNDQIKNPQMAVLSMDVVWTAEFAANGMVDALPPDRFPTDQFLPATVASATYFDKLYGYPGSSDGRLALLPQGPARRGRSEPPTTWDEIKAACKKIEADRTSRWTAMRVTSQKYEGLTVNFAEAVNSAGGNITGDAGQPVVDSPESRRGLSFLVDAFKDGTIPRGAITWQEEQGRQAFEDGELIFHRNWPYVYALASKKDGSSKVAGKFAVAALPGLSGPGVSSLGGHNLAIGRHAENKGTAADFVKFLTSERVMKSNVLATSAAPTITSLYTDPDITDKYPYMPILLQSIQTAEPRPKAVRYGDVTLSIQDSAYNALQGQVDPETALSRLQADLRRIITRLSVLAPGAPREEPGRSTCLLKPPALSWKSRGGQRHAPATPTPIRTCRASTGTASDRRPKLAPSSDTPVGLANLAGVEMWERFSFYGMQGILVFYLYYALTDGGLGLREASATSIVGAYGGPVYLSAILGAWLADRLLGAERALTAAADRHHGRPPLPGLGARLPRGGHRPDLHRRRIRHAEGHHHLRARRPVQPRGPAARRRLLHLLHGRQHRRTGRAAADRAAVAAPRGFHWGFGLAAVGMAIGLAQYLLLRRSTLGNAGHQITNPLDRSGKIRYGAIAAAVIVSGRPAVGDRRDHRRRGCPPSSSG